MSAMSDFDIAIQRHALTRVLYELGASTDELVHTVRWLEVETQSLQMSDLPLMSHKAMPSDLARAIPTYVRSTAFIWHRLVELNIHHWLGYEPMVGLIVDTVVDLVDPKLTRRSELTQLLHAHPMHSGTYFGMLSLLSSEYIEGELTDLRSMSILCQMFFGDLVDWPVEPANELVSAYLDGRVKLYSKMERGSDVRYVAYDSRFNYAGIPCGAEDDLSDLFPALSTYMYESDI